MAEATVKEPKAGTTSPESGLTHFAPLTPLEENQTSSFSLSRLFRRKGSSDSTKDDKDAKKRQQASGKSSRPSKMSIPTIKESSKEPTGHTHSHKQAHRKRTTEGRVSRHGAASSPAHRLRPEDHRRRTVSLRESSESTNRGNAVEIRTLPSVLKRLVAILDGRIKVGKEYKDPGDLKQYWMPDSQCKECYECGDKFNTFRRRHHCRVCGQIFCSRCCNQQVPGKFMGYTGDVRVCTYCCKVVLSYAQTVDGNGDLRAIREDLKNLTESHLSTSGSFTWYDAYRDDGTPKTLRKRVSPRPLEEGEVGRRRCNSASSDVTSSCDNLNIFDTANAPGAKYMQSDTLLMEEERNKLLQDSVQLRDLWLQIQHPSQGMEFQNHRYRLRTYTNCIVGNQLVDWLIKRDKATSRVQAVVLGQALLDAKWLECVTHTDQIFRDEYSLYRAGEMANHELESPSPSTETGDTPTMEDEWEPTWFREIQRDDKSDDSSADEMLLIEKPAEAPVAQIAIEYDGSHDEDDDDDDDDVIQSDGTKSSKYKKMSKETLPAAKKPVDSLSESTEQGRKQATFYLDLKPDNVNFRVKKTNKAAANAESEKDKDLYISVFPTLSGKYVSVNSQDSNLDSSQSSLGDDLLKASSQPIIVILPKAVIKLPKDALFLGKESPSPYEVEAPRGWQMCESLREENGERLAMKRLCSAHDQHTVAFIRQLLHEEYLSLWWSDIIMPLVRQISETVRPDVRHENDNMDIRQYVKFKKIPGGHRSDCCFVNGVVCTKNIAHKKMSHHILNPRILMVKGWIDHQRTENRLASIDPIVLQEREYLKNCVARITSLNPRPDILLVEKTVSRIAQDLLLEAGITLVLNVKPEVMDRIARCTQADLIPSIDQVAKPTLGFCHRFYLQNHLMHSGDNKTLMFFEGCASHLGCTVVLRGGSDIELKKVKQIMQFMVYMCYHSRLEISFLMDEFAMPPGQPDTKGSPPHTALAPNSRQKDKLAAKENPSEEKSSEKEKHAKMPLKEVVIGSPEEESPLEANIQADFAHPLQRNWRSASYVEVGDRETQLTSLISQFETEVSKRKLCTSPFLQQDMPYLLTDEGNRCVLRKYFPTQVFWSGRFELTPEREKQLERERSKLYELEPMRGKENSLHFNSRYSTSGVNIVPPHSFLSGPLKDPITNQQTAALLAEFRALGGRLQESKKQEKKRNALKNGKKKESRSFEQSLDVVSLASNTSTGSAIVWEQKRLESWVVLGDHQALSDMPLPNQTEVDCMDPRNHQHISVLFSSFSSASANAPNPCVSPWVVTMDFYGKNDITLGAFLERYCFRSVYQCPSETCDTPMVEHVRRFVHGQASIEITMQTLASPIPGQHNNILLWSICAICKQVTPIVPMSVESWSMSFAKYLELRFQGSRYTRRAALQNCAHSHHLDHIQCFAYRHSVASLQYHLVTLYEIALPPMLVAIQEKGHDPDTFFDQIKDLAEKGQKLYTAIKDSIDRIMALKVDSFSHEREEQIESLLAQEEMEFSHFQCCLEQLNSRVVSVFQEDENGDVSTSFEGPLLMWDVVDAIVNLKRMLSEASATWNARLQDFVHQDKNKKSKSPILRSKELAVDFANHSNTSSPKTPGQTPRGSQEDLLSATDEDALVIAENYYKADEADDQLEQSDTSSSAVINSSQSEDNGDANALQGADPASFVVCTIPEDTISQFEDAPEEVDAVIDRKNRDQESRSNSWKRRQSTQDPEKRTVKTLIAQLLPGYSLQPLPMAFSPDKHYLLPVCEKLPVVVYDQEPSSIIAYALSCKGYETQRMEAKKQLSEEKDPLQQISVTPVSKPPKGGDKVPAASSHDSTPEASSTKGVLSFFRGKHTPEQVSPNTRRRKEKQSGNLSGMDSVHYNPSSSDKDSFEESGYDDTDFPLFGKDLLEKGKKQAPSPHIELQFQDDKAKFFCRVYYAEQFRKLRKTIFPDGEERYIRSLSRCFSWTAKGGKSGSTFCKTSDERFILKQMSRLEVQSFVEFAPHYFQYIQRAHAEQHPTCLAKILGVYRIGYRNSQTNATLKQDLLVIENLFYGRKMAQVFDLKGSMRNRHVNISSKEMSCDIVLLDENLLKKVLDEPLYIRPHSKTVLTRAITYDTQFLSSHLVMDYSLLVGVDEVTNELVVGIIDYIRTFTWDKKLEMVVKSSGILGGQGKMPTVVSPELYRTRFCEAMDRYFLVVPDRWTGLSIGGQC
ncbi:1-phosphatidylinositol 3-phosphate 5-kinase-like isoform X13 [Branchiostoma lanceolatum]|uniref:1-phosphatidylinositol 3-phosphate 5-kinase-like isoform X13 n=1 Tax=Branchiostoma lanceolatum TaxID=7740 RepID=UPI0034572D3A